MIDGVCGCERLEQRFLRFAPGRSEERSTGERQELLYIVAGEGTLHVLGIFSSAVAPTIFDHEPDRLVEIGGVSGERLDSQRTAHRVSPEGGTVHEVSR